MKILIIGGSGLIGYNIYKNFGLSDNDIELTYFKNKILDCNAKQLDATNFDNTLNTIKKSNPDVVIQTTALAGVDLAETNHKLADSVTVETTKNIIQSCKYTQSKIVYVSTTYVYGNQKKIFSEDDEPNPISYYGFTKLKSENLVKNSGLPYLILRTDQPYFWTEKWQRDNSVTRVIKTLKEKNILKEVKDWYSVPTYVPDFVDATKSLIENSNEGIFNVTGSDYIDRYNWALVTANIFGLDKKLITSIVSDELSLPVKRDSINVSNEKISQTTGIKMKGIKDGLLDMLKLYESNLK